VPFANHSSSNALVSYFTKVYLCSSLYSVPFSTAALVTIYGMHIMALVQDLGKCKASKGFLHHSLLRILPQKFE